MLLLEEERLGILGGGWMGHCSPCMALSPKKDYATLGLYWVKLC